MKVLDLGCGTCKEKGAIGVDIFPLDNVDYVYDLNFFPYPFEAKSFDKIILNDVLEHLDNPIEVIRECYRLLKKGGKLKIRVLYWNHIYNYSDPTHKHVFAPRYFQMLTKETNRAYYFRFLFEKMRIHYTFDIEAIRTFGFNKEELMKRAYFLCNIIDGMRVTLYK